MPETRATPYIWVTWLTKLLVGENSCEWAAWFRAHHESWSYDKVPSTFDATTWQLNHTAVDQYSLDNPVGFLTYPDTFVAQGDLMFGGVLGGAVTPGSVLDRSALGYRYARDQPLEDRVVALGFPPIVTA